jgi:LPS-assembly protein
MKLKLFFILFFISKLYAIDTPKTIIKSDKIDKNGNEIIAIGDVEIEKGDMYIKSDEVKYNTETKEIITEKPSKIYDYKKKRVYFVESAKFKDDGSEGEYENGIILMSNGTLLQSNKIIQKNNFYKLKKAKYNACPINFLDKEDKNAEKEQVKEDKSVIILSSTIDADLDNNEMNIWNGIVLYHYIPIFYFPYFRSTINEADSGFNSPSIVYNSYFGYGILTPYVLKTHENKITFSPTFFLFNDKDENAFDIKNYALNTTFSNKNFSLSLDMANDRGYSKQIKTHIRNLTEEEAGLYKQYRGMLKISGRWNNGNNLYIKYNTKLTTDRYYTRDYHNNLIEYNTSNINIDYVDNKDYNNYNYFSFKNIFFQEFILKNRNNETPVYIPIIDLNLEKKYFNLKVNTTSLIRESHKNYRERNYNRISITPQLRTSFETDIGLIKTDVNINANLFFINENNYNNLYETYNNIMPQFNIEWSKNIVLFDNILISPIVKYSYSPPVKNKNNKSMANEDSSPININFSNIFTNNKFIGYDRMEFGNRISYGIESVFYERVFMGIAQGYRDNIDKQELKIEYFNEELSDYVGYVSLYFNRYLNFYYRFLMEKESLFLKKNEIETEIKYGIFTTSFTYFKGDTNNNTKHQLIGTTNLQITKKIKLSFAFTNDLKEKQLVSSEFLLEYDDGCVIWQANYKNNNPINNVDRNYQFSIDFTTKFF